MGWYAVGATVRAASEAELARVAELVRLLVTTSGGDEYNATVAAQAWLDAYDAAHPKGSDTT